MLEVFEGKEIVFLSMLVHYYLSFHRLSEWLGELVFVNQDFSSETSDTEEANWDLSLWLKAEHCGKKGTHRLLL